MARHLLDARLALLATAAVGCAHAEQSYPHGVHSHPALHSRPNHLRDEEEGRSGHNQIVEVAQPAHEPVRNEINGQQRVNDARNNRPDNADEQPPRDERRACNQQRPGRTDSAAQALQGELDPFPRLRIVTQRVASTRRDATRRDEVWLLGLRAAAAARHAPERRARTRNSAIPTRQPHPYRGSVAVAVVVRHDAAQHDDAALSDGCAPFRGPEALHQLLGFRAAHGALDDSGQAHSLPVVEHAVRAKRVIARSRHGKIQGLEANWAVALARGLASSRHVHVGSAHVRRDSRVHGADVETPLQRQDYGHQDRRRQEHE
mmetsp:Transcript_1229/g.4801  ORF Transcript_1229/g.4801 Transcript_1229/m.4801 type:complete len:318 (-) Transcript_1229:36-989(-)